MTMLEFPTCLLCILGVLAGDRKRSIRRDSGITKVHFHHLLNTDFLCRDVQICYRYLRACRAEETLSSVDQVYHPGTRLMSHQSPP